MKSKIRVHFLAHSGMSMLDFSGPLEVFLAANGLSRKTEAPYAIEVISLDGKVKVLEGFFIETRLFDHTTLWPHTLIVPGGPNKSSVTQYPELISLIRKHGAHASRVAAICSGAFALAAAGLLDNHNATTHWSFLDDLQQEFPKINVQRGPVFVKDRCVWTSAGLTAGIDMALALVEQDIGPGATMEIARQLVMSMKRPAAHHQASDLLTIQSRSETFSSLHAWISGNLGADLSVRKLADRMNMSLRTFIRHYQNEMGQTPAKGVESLRMTTACYYLEFDSVSIGRIASACGYADEATFIRRFSKSFGMPPGRWRASSRDREIS